MHPSTVTPNPHIEVGVRNSTVHDRVVTKSTFEYYYDTRGDGNRMSSVFGVIEVSAINHTFSNQRSLQSY